MNDVTVDVNAPLTSRELEGLEMKHCSFSSLENDECLWVRRTPSKDNKEHKELKT